MKASAPVTGSCLYHSILIVCQEAATVPLPAWEQREFHSLLPVGGCSWRLCPVLLVCECSDPVHRVWQRQAGATQHCILCVGSRATTLLLQPHLERRGGCLRVASPMGRAVLFSLSWSVHLHMESAICFPREESSPSLVQRSAGQNRGQA